MKRQTVEPFNLRKDKHAGRLLRGFGVVGDAAERNALKRQREAINDPIVRPHRVFARDRDCQFITKAN